MDIPKEILDIQKVTKIATYIINQSLEELSKQLNPLEIFSALEVIGTQLLASSIVGASVMTIDAPADFELILIKKQQKIIKELLAELKKSGKLYANKSN